MVFRLYYDNLTNGVVLFVQPEWQLGYLAHPARASGDTLGHIHIVPLVFAEQLG